MTKNERKVDIFLNRLDWRTNTGEITEFDMFQVDVFCFKIRRGLDGEKAKAFSGYLKTLPMAELRSTMKIFIWMYQQGVDFRLVFRWNPRLSVRYNLGHLFEPRRVRKTLLANGHDDLMSCPLEELDKEEE